MVVHSYSKNHKGAELPLECVNLGNILWGSCLRKQFETSSVFHSGDPIDATKNLFSILCLLETGLDAIGVGSAALWGCLLTLCLNGRNGNLAGPSHQKGRLQPFKAGASSSQNPRRTLHVLGTPCCEVLRGPGTGRDPKCRVTEDPEAQGLGQRSCFPGA